MVFNYLSGIVFLMVMGLMLPAAVADSPKTIPDQSGQTNQKHAEDSLLYETLFARARDWESKNLDTSLFYYDQSIALASRHNWHRREAKALVNKGFADFYQQRSASSLRFLYEAINIYESISDQQGMMDSYYNLGYLYGNLEDYVSAIVSYKKCIEIAQQLDNKQRLAAALDNLGLLYNYSGQYDLSNEYIIQSIRLKEAMGDPTVGYTHINLALNYLEHQQFDKSLEHNFKGLKLFQQKVDLPSIGRTLKNIGDVYSEMSKIDSARLYYEKAFEIYREIKDEEGLARCNMVMGVLHRKEGNSARALEYYYQALNTIPKVGSNKLLFAIYSNIIEADLALYESGAENSHNFIGRDLMYAQKMESIAHQLNAQRMKAGSYEKLFKLYMLGKNEKEALKYANLYIATKDSVYSDNKQKATAEMQIRYETEKKELEIEVLSSEKQLLAANLEKSDAQKKSRMIIIYLLTAGFVLISVFVLIILKFYRQTRKALASLKQKNEIIQRQKDEKELLLQEINHRVKNNFQIIISMLGLQIKGATDETVRTSLLEANNRIESIAIVHQILYQNDDKISIPFRLFVDRLQNHLLQTYQKLKPVEVSLDIPESVRFNVKTCIPLGIIINEMLTNALKYAFPEGQEGHIAISLRQDSASRYALCFADDGIGLPPDHDIEKASSLGLRMIKILCQQLHGEMMLPEGQGTRFLINFELSDEE